MRKVIDRGLQVGAFCIERTRALLEVLHLALSREIPLADPLRLGAQLREAFMLANAIAAGQRGFEFSPDRGEIGLDRCEKSAFEFFNEGVGAFALESPVNRFTLERRKSFARLLEPGTRRINFAFTFDASGLEFLDRGFELAMARGRGFVLCGKIFQFAVKFDAFGVRTFKLRAMLLNLRFEFRGELAQMAMFLLESTERGLARLDSEGVCLMVGLGLGGGGAGGLDERRAVLKIVMGAVAAVLAATTAYDTVGPQEVAFARNEDSAVAVKVRRRQRGAQVLGHHHMAEQCLPELNIARLDLAHAKQAAQNPGRLDRRICCTCGH